MIIQLWLHLVLPCICIHIRFQLHQQVCAVLTRTMPHRDQIAQSREGRLYLPLQKFEFLPMSCSLGLFCENMRDSYYSPRELCNAVIGPTTIVNWDCGLHNSNSQLLDWTVHYIVPVVIQRPSSPNRALCSFGIQSPDPPAEIVQPSWLVTWVFWRSVLKFILVLD